MQGQVTQALTTAAADLTTEAVDAANESVNMAKPSIGDYVAFRDNVKRGVQMYEFKSSRIEKLMRRKSSAKWSETKKHKMIRRQAFAQEYLRDAPGVIEELDKTITKLKTEEQDS